MTLRTSLFNKGIYKSILKRFWWVMIPQLILISVIHFGYDLGLSLTDNVIKYKMIIEAIWYTSSLTQIFSWIVALLAYGSIHSKKQATFIYSLPISKEANFISSALAGLTLVIVPIIINWLVMLYCELNWIVDYYTAGYSFIWLGMNVFCAFVIFAYMTFAGVIAGNGFVAFVLSAILVWSMTIIPFTVDMLADNFLLGYELQFPNAWDVTVHPVQWVLVTSSKIFAGGHTLTVEKVSIMDFIPKIIVATVLYVVSFILYRNRKIESAGEGAGFKVLKPIFKYFITAFAVVVTVNVLYSDTINVMFLVLAIIAVSAVIYFSMEMALNKTIHVLKSYKGYLVFMAVVAVFTILLTNTSFFGYETRIPDVEDIESVALYDYNENSVWGMNIPYVENEELKQFTTELHREIVDNNLIVSGPDSEYYLKIKYKLKNGNVISRKYGIDRQIYYKAMDKCYEYEDWRRAIHKLYKEVALLENAEYIKIGYDVYLYGDNCTKLLDCIYQDVIDTHYDYTGITGKYYDVFIYYNTGEWVQLNSINNRYENTVAWLTEIGEWQKLK